ncbi:MAG: hypothetical protein AABY74_09880, partial [Planctomycetota bacterium]
MKTLILVFRGCAILNLIFVLNNVYLHLSAYNDSQIHTAQKISAHEGNTGGCINLMATHYKGDTKW